MQTKQRRCFAFLSINSQFNWQRSYEVMVSMHLHHRPLSLGSLSFLLLPFDEWLPPKSSKFILFSTEALQRSRLAGNRVRPLGNTLTDWFIDKSTSFFFVCVSQSQGYSLTHLNAGKSLNEPGSTPTQAAITQVLQLILHLVQLLLLISATNQGQT